MAIRYRMCTRCIMDTSDPEISFDDSGACNHCRAYDELAKQRLHTGESGQRMLVKMVERMKHDGRGKEYDCVLGISGGVDSTYCAYLTKKLGLRPLAVHFDCGWDSELAVSNIENLLNKLEIDLHTLVVDWEEMRDVQLAFLRSGVPNCDIPSDHAIIASMFAAAAENNVRYVVSGANIATEAILPSAWGYTFSDLRHLKSVHKRFGTRKLLRFPLIGLFDRFVWHRFVKRVEFVRVLDYVDYVKSDAMKLLEREFDWRYYGGKHYESQFTKFFQAYYLPRKFGYDKRRAHLSSLIVSGQMAREDALLEMQKEICPLEEMAEVREYVSKKLRISVEELDELVTGPNHTHFDYPSNRRIFSLLHKLNGIENRVRAGARACSARIYGRRSGSS